MHGNVGAEERGLMNEFGKDVVALLQNGGWQAIVGLFIWLAYKTSITGLIVLGIYKGVSRLLSVIESGTLARRCASELGTHTPLTPDEEHTIILAVRASKQNE